MAKWRYLLTVSMLAMSAHMAHAEQAEFNDAFLRALADDDGRVSEAEALANALLHSPPPSREYDNVPLPDGMAPAPAGTQTDDGVVVRMIGAIPIGHVDANAPDLEEALPELATITPLADPFEGHTTHSGYHPDEVLDPFEAMPQQQVPLVPVARQTSIHHLDFPVPQWKPAQHPWLQVEKTAPPSQQAVARADARMPSSERINLSNTTGFGYVARSSNVQEGKRITIPNERRQAEADAPSPATQRKMERARSNVVLSPEDGPDPNAVIITRAETPSAPTRVERLIASASDFVTGGEPAQAPSRRTSPFVSDARFTSAVINRTPADQLDRASTSLGKLNFFSAIVNKKGEDVVHRWEMNGVKLFDVPFTVGGDMWRIWSQVQLNEQVQGTLTVRVIDGSGQELSRNDIEVYP